MVIFKNCRLSIFVGNEGVIICVLYLDADQLWKLITSEVPLFSWDDDDDTLASAIRPKSKKTNVKETAVFRVIIK